MLCPFTTPLDAPVRRPGGVYTVIVFDLDFFGDFVSGGRSNFIGVIPARFRLGKRAKRKIIRQCKDKDRPKLSLKAWLTRCGCCCFFFQYYYHFYLYFFLSTAAAAKQRERLGGGGGGFNGPFAAKGHMLQATHWDIKTMRLHPVKFNTFFVLDVSQCKACCPIRCLLYHVTVSYKFCL